MLSDLTRALFAAVLVGVLPGWFWARCLCATADRTERLTHSVALSITLVPAAALAQVRLLSTGVTPTTTVLSVTVVFLGGLGAYLGFGPAKGPDEPIASRPPSLSRPALVPLVLAFAFVVGADLELARSFSLARSCWGWTSDACASGGSPRRSVLPVALLLLLSGVLHLVVSRREGGPQVRPREARPVEPRGRAVVLARRLLLPAVLLVVLLRGYLGPVLHDWPFIRGVDLYSHAVMANLMLSQGNDSSYLIYPPGFHILTAEISRLSGLEPLRIYPVLAPALVLLSALSCYVVGRRVWGWECGVVAAFFCGVLVGGTYYYFDDAMYPNLVAAQFLLVLTVAALVGTYAAPSLRAGLLLALIGSSVVFYHQVSSLYLALLLALVVALFVPYLLVRDRRMGMVLLSSLALLGFLSVLYAWDTYHLPQVIANLLGSSKTSSTDTAVGMAVGTQRPYTLDGLLGAIVSQPVAWLGLLGALLLLGDPGSWKSTPRALTHLTLILWVLLLFAGSRTSLSGFPQRFGRDLGVPLALLAARAFVTVVRSAVRSREPELRKGVTVYLASVAVLLAASLAGLRAAQSLQQAAGPSPEVTMTPQIAAAGRWLRDHNSGGNIMVSPQENQVPSRMMLAMGHYSALQSFTAPQLPHPRDLPPTGPKPLRAVLWVMNHPEGERTEQILKKYDVRYVVLYKREPDRPVLPYWRLFEDRPNLYRTVFENKAVLIVARRGDNLIPPPGRS